MDRALLALSALLVNAGLAGPRSWYEALGLTRLSRIPANAVRQIERKLNRDHRSLKEREIRGAVLVGFAVILSIALGRFCAAFFTGDLHFLELALVAALLPLRPTWDIALQIRRALQRGNSASARQLLEHTAWRHHALLDDHGLSRAAIEILAVHFSEKILAPVVWYLVFGLPGLFLSKALYLLQETLVRPPLMNQGFSVAAKIAHYLLHYGTSRLAALFWLLVSLFMPSCKPSEVFGQILSGIAGDSPQRLSLLSAASVLNLSLGGPSSIYAPEGWVGKGTAKASTMDIRRALYLFGLLLLFLFVFIGCFLR